MLHAGRVFQTLFNDFKSDLFAGSCSGNSRSGSISKVVQAFYTNPLLAPYRSPGLLGKNVKSSIGLSAYSHSSLSLV